MKKLGLIINPIAGLGGRVGLKGTDGPEVVRRALELGAAPEGPARARRALERLLPLREKVVILTYPGNMGGAIAADLGFAVELVGKPEKVETTAEDTKKAAKEILKRGAELLLFCGGDGTARDVYAAVKTGLASLGIPAGVKMHSGVFAPTPERAGEVARRYLEREIRQTREVEVMDIDEAAFRRGQVKARLFGYLVTPWARGSVQGAKVGTSPSERHFQEAIAARVIEDLKRGTLYLIGPGTTAKAILAKLGLDGTLLGVDALLDGKLIGKDLAESDMLELVRNHPARIVLSPIGGQGHILGRGNQQLSPAVIRTANGKASLIVVATPGKLASLGGKPLLVDTGDPDLDKELSGYVQVLTGYRQRAVYRVSC
ncbi:MAG: Uncharacterized protein XD60_0458 [Acetothermia bacterium 64_32]|nr:MAG: Uncharacterized protein XD60_0458 [Acetothermia bacterium 64_32]HAF70977.1 ATP-NAD kinase [Candidatus Acetothermia bacterium]